MGDPSLIEYPVGEVSYTVALSAVDGGSWSSGGQEDLAQIKIANGIRSAVRWASPIPQGATITAARVTATSSWTQSGAVNGILSFYEADDAAALPGGFYASEWSSETAQVLWGITEDWPENSQFDSVDIANSLQAVTDRAGYAADNRVMLFFNYYSVGSVGFRFAYSNPTLHVTYTA